MTTKPIIRMSSAGKCPRAMSAELLGYSKESLETPKFLELAAEEGREHESIMKRKLMQEGYTVESCSVCPICAKNLGEVREGIHVELHFELFDMIGHMDARLHRLMDSQRGCELKSKSQYEFDRWKKEGWQGFYHEAGQIACYMEAEQHDEWVYWIKNRNTGYIDKFLLIEPPMPLEFFLDRITQAIIASKENRLATADFDPSNIVCRRCSFSKLCIPELENLPEATKLAMDKACQDWRAGVKLSGQGELLQEQAKEIFWSFNQDKPKYRYNGLNITKFESFSGAKYDAKVLEDTFDLEQLLPALKDREKTWKMRITDTQKDKEE